MHCDSYSIFAAAITYRLSMDSDSRWGRTAGATPEPTSLVSERWTLCVCWQEQIQRIQEGRKYTWNGAK
jgi:hypothetical protein